MTSALKNDFRRASALARIVAAWDKVPDLKLGELLLLSCSPSQAANFASIDDADLASAVERFVLLRVRG